MHKLRIAAALIPALLATAALGQDETGMAVEDELKVVALAAIPPKVMTAARSVAPDVSFQSAESYWLDDSRVYEITGRLFREVWIVLVTDTGRVLRVERDNQDD